MRKIIGCLVALTIFLGSCEKVDSLTGTTWEAVKYSTPDETKRAPSEIILTFDSDGSINLQLEINSCGSFYSLSNNNKLTISGLGCTEVCCDSDFSTTLAQLLSTITSYEFNGNRLILTGEENELIFKIQ